MFLDPLGQPKVTAGIGIIVFAHAVCPYVRPHFSNLAKQYCRKQYSLPARLWVWPSGSLMTPVVIVFFSFLQIFINFEVRYAITQKFRRIALGKKYLDILQQHSCSQIFLSYALLDSFQPRYFRSHPEEYIKK